LFFLLKNKKNAEKMNKLTAIAAKSL